MVAAWQVVGSFGIEQLRQMEVPREPLGPRDVRVQLHAASLNYRDWLMVTGAYNPRQPLPLVPCSDGAGVVVEVGAQVRRWRIGDRVMGLFAQGWHAGPARRDRIRQTLGGPLQGTLRHEMVLPEDGVARVPEHLDFRQAATLPCAGLTAWSALEQGGLTAGETVLVQGTGGVSLFAAQLAKQRGARVLGTSKSHAKLARMAELGLFDVGINYAEQPQWSQAVREATAGEGVDLVVEVGGGGTLAESLKSVRAGGCVAVIGVLSGGASTLPLTPLLMQNVRLQGVYVGHAAQQEALRQALEMGRLQPMVDRVYSWEQVPAAFADLARGEHMGKLVIEWGDA